MTLLARRNTWAKMQDITAQSLNEEFNNIVNQWNLHDQGLSAWQKLNVSGTTTFNTAVYTWPGSLPAANSLLQSTSGGVLSWVTSSGAFAPVNSPFVTIGNDSTLTSERALTGTSNQIVFTDNGANSTVVASIANPVTFPGAMTAGGALAMGSNKITGLSNGTAATDAAAFGQVHILQVVMGTSTTGDTTTSTSFTNTSLSASITPASSSNKVLIYATGVGGIDGTVASSALYTLTRGTTNLLDATNGGQQVSTALAVNTRTSVAMTYLDSPATTSSTTYRVQFRTANASDTVYWSNTLTSVIILMEVQ